MNECNGNWLNMEPAQAKLVALFRELVDYPGYGEIRVDIKTLKKGDKEVVLSSGKQYRYILKLKSGKPFDGAQGKEKAG